MQKSQPAVSSSRRRVQQHGQALMLMSVGIVFLVGTLGFLADASYSYYNNHIAAPSHSVYNQSVAASDGAVASSSTRGVIAKYWVAVSQHLSIDSFSYRAVLGGSLSAMWLGLVAAATLCMYCTRP